MAREDTVALPTSIQEIRNQIRRYEDLQDRLEELRLAAIDEIEGYPDATRGSFMCAYHIARRRAENALDPEVRSKALHAVFLCGHALSPVDGKGPEESGKALIDEITAAIDAAQDATLTRLHPLYTFGLPDE